MRECQSWVQWALGMAMLLAWPVALEADEEDADLPDSEEEEEAAAGLSGSDLHHCLPDCQGLSATEPPDQPFLPRGTVRLSSASGQD